jgi:hypothetical protein
VIESIKLDAKHSPPSTPIGARISHSALLGGRVAA